LQAKTDEAWAKAKLHGERAEKQASYNQCACDGSLQPLCVFFTCPMALGTSEHSIWWGMSMCWRPQVEEAVKSAEKQAEQELGEAAAS
jgi:hypothetical protein